ncbi:MAG: glycosyltransferase family 4 protein [Candidatus Omnitrophica bacterium]|nr:glycosyltransferase family 4 protein [Candidatus Omnitrophota bacterium]
MKVLFIVPYPLDTTPSQRLKFEQYFEYFRQNGITIGFSSFVSPAFRKILYKKGYTFKKVIYTVCGYFRRISDIFKAGYYDIIYLHLEAAPFGPPIFEYMFYILGKPIIYDIDDIIYIPHVSDANKLIKFLKDPKKIHTIMRLSKHIIVVTDYLGRFAEKFNKNITYIPPTIDTDKYSVANKNNDKKICVGWTGSHSTSKYLYLLEEVLKNISQSYDIRLKVIGDTNFKISGLNIEVKDWSSLTEVGDIQDIDIGLYPLPKNEWVMGKGGLKALQYMGMGIPVVCTRVGAVLNFIQDGVNGFLADSDQEWIEKISRLIKNADLRKRIGLAARKTVEEKFSVKANAPNFLQVLQKVYNS